MASKLLELLERAEAYEQGVTILAEGSIARALETYNANNPRWQFCNFNELPGRQKCEVLLLAELVEL